MPNVIKFNPRQDFKLNHAGIRTLLESDAVGAVVKAAAEQIAASAGAGFEVVGPWVAEGNRNPEMAGRVAYTATNAADVVAMTEEARIAEANDKALSQAAAQAGGA